MNLIASVNRAKKLQKKEKWQEATKAWNKIVDIFDPAYQFQADACKIIAEAVKMQEEIPVRRPTTLMVMSGDKHIIIEPKGLRKE